jgi:hypothetical protein
MAASNRIETVLGSVRLPGRQPGYYNDVTQTHEINVTIMDRPTGPTTPPSDPAQSLCDYVRLENGIHKLIVRHASRAAADEWIAHIDGIIANMLESGETIRLLSDASAGVLPLGYVSSKARVLIRKYQNPPRIRYANLISSPGMAGLINTIIRALHIPKLKLHIFAVHQQAEAIAWLLSDD